jgi:hypothetical protein
MLFAEVKLSIGERELIRLSMATLTAGNVA